jgi:hypothetical protein
VFRHQGAHGGGIEAALTGDAADLEFRRRRADVGVEAAGGGGDQIDRDRRGVAGVGGLEVGSMRALTASARAGFSGPRLEPDEAPAL